MLLDGFLSRLSDVHEEGDGWLARCPAHADTHASLRVAVGDRRVLLKCRAGCDTEAVLRALGITYADLPDVSLVPGGAGKRARSADVPADPAAVAALAVRLDAYRDAVLSHPDGEALVRYAEDRFGLAVEDVQRLTLGLADDLGGGVRLVVPFRDRAGVARGFQARAIDPAAEVRWIGPKSPEGQSWARVGLFPGSAGWPEVFVCEGPGDALTACALGFDAVGIRGAGLASNPAVADEVAAIVGDRTAILAGDGDPAGARFSAALAQALVDRGVQARILAAPEGLDLTSWRERDGAAFTREVVRAAQAAAPVTSASAALASRAESDYPLTDLGNAWFVRDYIAARGSGVRYSPDAGFFLLSGGVWRADRLDGTRALAQDAARVTADIAATLAREAGDDTRAQAQAKRWAAWARHSQSRNGIDAAVRELQALSDVAVDFNDFDRHDHLLACRNGVINLRTGRLQPHNPALLLTRRIDVDFDPDAQAPRWEAFLSEVFPAHPSLPVFVRRLVGYGVTGSTAEQCFVVLWGTGANGKSVFTDTLTEVFREVTTTTPFSTFEERTTGGIPNDLAALKGARLVMASEGEAGKPMAEAVLKRVTGRDLVAARFLRREFFEFRPAFLLFLATNTKPNFRGQDEGLWRRVKLIPWERYFAPAERDHRLGDALLAERAGIVAWAVRGAVEWYAGGLDDPAVVREATAEYRETSDALFGFLGASQSRAVTEAGFVATGEAADLALGAVLWDAYREWADAQGLPAREKLTQRGFYQALEDRGLAKVRVPRGMAFRGVRQARHADAVPDHDRAEPGGLALSSGEGPLTVSGGPSLDGCE